MSATEFTYSDVAEHNTKKDLYVVIHDKVYDCTKFVDEHPGGEEVILDVAGQDATEAFEDVGHSDEARETLEPLYVGTLKRQPGDPTFGSSQTDGSSSTKNTAGDIGIGLYALVFAGAIAAYFGYQYLQATQEQPAA